MHICNVTLVNLDTAVDIVSDFVRYVKVISVFIRQSPAIDLRLFLLTCLYLRTRRSAEASIQNLFQSAATAVDYFYLYASLLLFARRSVTAFMMIVFVINFCTTLAITYLFVRRPRISKSNRRSKSCEDLRQVASWRSNIGLFLEICRTVRGEDFRALVVPPEFI